MTSSTTTTTIMSRAMSLVLFLLLASTTSTNAQCGLSEPIQLSQRNGGLFMEQTKDSAAGTYTMRLTYKGGNAWIGVGINTNGSEDMEPAEAVIGRVMSDGETTSVMHYKLTSTAEDASGVNPVSSTSSLQDATFEQPDDSTTILTFTQNMDEMGVTDDSQWIFGVGLPNNMWGGEHVINGAFKIALTDTCQEGGSSAESGLELAEEYEYGNLWMAHGVLMAIAWGVCAPLAIGASLLRDFLFDRVGSNWFPLHMYLNMMTLLLTMAGFLVAVVAMQKSEGSGAHFQDAHHKIGLSILILVVLQALAGYLRPHLPISKEPNSKSEGGDEQEKAHDSQKASSKAAGPTPPKTLVRKVWEIGHRLVGAVLVALAWYNIQDGIDIQERHFETMEWAPIFWGIAGTISAVIVVLKGYSVMTYRREEA